MKSNINKIFSVTLMLLTLSSEGLAQANNPESYTFTTKQYSVRYTTGFVHSRKSDDFLSNSPKSSFLAATGSVPGAYSMRGQAGPVEDQGQCGSCWDFSLTTVLRGTWIMAGQDKGRLSFNYLLNCDTQLQGCTGGDFSAASMFVQPSGAPAYGSDGNYTGQQGSCMHEPAVASSIAYHMLGTNNTNPSFKDIAYVVGVLHRPVSVDVAADQNGSWMNYSSGVYNACNNNTIDHMVSIEGYSCESSVDGNGNCVFDSSGNLPAGVGLWIIRNSWGTTWGDGGYITTKATDQSGARCNAVATDALYYDVQTPSPSPNPTPAPTPVPTPTPTPNSGIASTPTFNGQQTLVSSNPNQSVIFAYDVSNFANAASVYYEAIGPNRNFSQPNGVTPDNNHLSGGTLKNTKGGFNVLPAQQLPSWGTYYFRVIPLDSTGRQAVGKFSNPATLILQQQQ